MSIKVIPNSYHVIFHVDNNKSSLHNALITLGSLSHITEELSDFLLCQGYTREQITDLIDFIEDFKKALP
jgi:hypothetical protein